jgi:hypothetical protein
LQLLLVAAFEETKVRAEEQTHFGPSDKTYMLQNLYANKRVISAHTGILQKQNFSKMVKIIRFKNCNANHDQ